MFISKAEKNIIKHKFEDLNYKIDEQSKLISEAVLLIGFLQKKLEKLEIDIYGKPKGWSIEQRKLQSDRMKAYWEGKKQP